MPTTRELWEMARSLPVVFQYPVLVALFDLHPLGYFLSLGLKKYHCLSPVCRIDFSVQEKKKKKYKGTSIQSQEHTPPNGII